MSIKNKKIVAEHFNFLSNNVGPGESACMSVARFNDNVIGSSNLSDISKYCKDHKISYLTTLDFLFIGVIQNQISEKQFDEAIEKLRNNDYRVPKITFDDFSRANVTLRKQCDLLNK
jgi:hypothetical protein